MKNIILLFVALFATTSAIAQTQSTDQKDSGKVAVVDGGLGPCSMDLVVLGPDAKPVYGASVKVHIAYGFGGFHKLDLEGGTNSDGKVKFTGLPARVRRPPLEFIATEKDLTATVTYDPAMQCEAKQQVTLQPAPAAPNQAH